MCNFLFAAADQPLPALEWDEEHPSVYLSTPQEAELKAIRSWLTKPFVYHVGSHEGCGCPFCYELDWEQITEEELVEWNTNREDFHQLAAYLEAAIISSGPVELYNAWDYWDPPLERRSISIRDIRGDRFVFGE